MIKVLITLCLSLMPITVNAISSIELIKEFEGLRLNAYYDVDRYAIGYGYTHGTRKGDTMTKVQAETLLQDTIVKYKKAIKSNVKVRLNNYQSIALVSLVYNIGETAFSNSTLLMKLNNGDYTGAASEFDRWVYIGNRKSQGLINRRKKEKELFLKGTK